MLLNWQLFSEHRRQDLFLPHLFSSLSPLISSSCYSSPLPFFLSVLPPVEEATAGINYKQRCLDLTTQAVVTTGFVMSCDDSLPNVPNKQVFTLSERSTCCCKLLPHWESGQIYRTLISTISQADSTTRLLSVHVCEGDGE